MSVTLAKSDCTTGASVGLTTSTVFLPLALSTPFHAAACWVCCAFAVVAKVPTAGGTGPSLPAPAAERPAS